MSLAGAGTTGSTVELVRCSGCGQNTWRVDGLEVDKPRALAALSAAFPASPSGPVRRGRGRRPAARPADGTATDLSGLLTGWQVLGSAR